MKGKDLYQAMGSISEQHLTDTLQYFRMRRRMRFIKIGSVAAAFCIVTAVTATIALHLNLSPAPLDPIEPTEITSNENGFLIRNGELIKYTGDETDVVIPETVSSIADNAFADTKDINSVTLTANVKRVGYEAFSCERGVRLLLSEDNQHFTDTDGAIISADGTVLLQYTGRGTEEYIIPDGVRQIGAFAFYEAEIDSIIFPDGLESIGKGAFSGCSLQEISLPDSVKYIGAQAFSECIHAVDGTVPEDAQIGTDAFFRVPFYTSLLAGHSCPGEDIQRGTITPSAAFIQSGYLQQINEKVLEHVTTGNFPSKVYNTDDLPYDINKIKKIDLKEATFTDGSWGTDIECRANIYITDETCISVGLVCVNPYDCTDWEDVEWLIRRAEPCSEIVTLQDVDNSITVQFERDKNTMNLLLTKVQYNGKSYSVDIKQAAFQETFHYRDLLRVADGIYVLSWLTCENAFDQWIYSYGNTSRGRIEYAYTEHPTLTVLDLRGGKLSVHNYFDTIEGFAFKVYSSMIHEDGLYKITLEDQTILSIDWVQYLAERGGVELQDFETITIHDIADIDQLQLEKDSTQQLKVDLLCTFLQKDTAALEEKISQYGRPIPNGTYDLYQTLEFGDYTISRLLYDPGIDYQGHDIFLEVEILQSEVQKIPVGKQCFVVTEGPEGYNIVLRKRSGQDQIFTVKHPDLWELYHFMGLQRMTSWFDMEIPDIKELSTAELENYKKIAVTFIIDSKGIYEKGYLTVDEIIAYGKKLFGLTLTEDDVWAADLFSYPTKGNRIYVGGHGGNIVDMDLLDRTDWGDTITVTVRYYAEGSFTIPAKDVKYTLTKTPDGLAFLTPSEVVQDYGREVWGFLV